MNSTGLVGRKKEKTTIIQRYLVPFLYNGRKFDIRSYMLVTWVNNSLNAYVYEECYIRTSSKQFDLDSQNKYVHLTNDAIQCMSH
jgi:tubulin polyglutamylase TTLL1/tubulin monoglycylase TTLL3/8